MDCDPPDRPTALPWEPKLISMAHLRRIASTPVGLDSIPDNELLEATPYGMGIDDGTEYVAVWITWDGARIRASFGKFIERTDYESLVPLRELLRMAPDDLSSIGEAVALPPSPSVEAPDARQAVAAEATRLADRWSAGGKPRQATLRLLRAAIEHLGTDAVSDLEEAVGVLGRGDLGRRSRTLVVQVLSALARRLTGGQP